MLFPGYNTVKYADDTSFYVTVPNNSDISVAPAIEHTKQWSASNSMQLNADKTVVMNFYINHLHKHDEPVIFDNTSIAPSKVMKFLGISIDDHLTFIDHVDSVIKRCNSKLFLMRQLKRLGMRPEGLRTFYCANIRSIIAYGAPVFYQFLSATTKDRLEKVQKSATKIIYPDLPFDDRLTLLDLHSLNDFIFSLSVSHFKRIANNENHPLHNRVIFNNSKRSSRCCTDFRPPQPRTEKRINSFFIYFMSYFNSSDHEY